MLYDTLWLVVLAAFSIVVCATIVMDYRKSTTSINTGKILPFILGMAYGSLLYEAFVTNRPISSKIFLVVLGINVLYFGVLRNRGPRNNTQPTA